MRENVEKYQTLFEISPSGIVLLDENGIILESNDAISKILQYSAKELKGMNVRKLSLPERYDKIDSDIKKILSGKILNNEIENIRKDGSICILELHEKAIDLKNGARGILATVNDITLRKQSQEAEINLRKQLNKILDLVPSYIFAKDYDGKFLMVNKSLADLFGVSPNDVVGKTDSDYGATPEQIKGYLKADRKVIDSGKEIFIKEEQVLRKDGSLGWFQTHKIPYQHPGIDKPAILGVAVDITERKQVEDKLKESESRYRELFELAVDGILIDSNEGIIIDVNESFCKIIGRAKKTIIGKHISELPFTKESLTKKPLRFDLLKKGETVINEREFLLPDGSVAFVEMRSKMLPDGTYHSIFRDVTERQKADAELRESKDRLQSIFRVAPTGIGVVRDRVLIEVNPKFCEMLGYSQKEIVGKSARILYQTQEEFDYVGKEKYKQISDKGTGTVETKWVKKDGTIIDVLLSSTPIDYNDHSKGVTFTSLDITELKNTEKTLWLKNLVFDKSNSANSIADANGILTETNDMFHKIWGYSKKKDCIGKSIAEFLQNPDEAAAILKSLNETGVWKGEYLAKRKDGSNFNAYRPGYYTAG